MYLILSLEIKYTNIFCWLTCLLLPCVFWSFWRYLIIVFLLEIIHLVSCLRHLFPTQDCKTFPYAIFTCRSMILGSCFVKGMRPDLRVFVCNVDSQWSTTIVHFGLINFISWLKTNWAIKYGFISGSPVLFHQTHLGFSLSCHVSVFHRYF